MDSKLYIHRAENEIKLGGIIFLISEDPAIQKETFKIKENPEKQLSPTLKGGDLRRFSETDFLKSNVAKSIAAFIPTHKWLGFLLI